MTQKIRTENRFWGTFILLFITFIFLSGCSRKQSFIGDSYNGTVPPQDQEKAAYDVIARLLGKEAASYFKVEITPSENAEDFFEVEPAGKKIILRGSNGVSACRGLKWYLNNICHCSVSWRGDNLDLPDPLPVDFPAHRESSPFQYRYIFNNCIYGYTMPWWQWPEWERMLDVLAINGINMPACLLGQEKVWQETYMELGLSKTDLDEFFAGPAWYPWQWMGNLDGWGGPLPQSVIDLQSQLQKKILSRARSLGMTPVLPGFSGHIPEAMVKQYPDLKYHTMEWWGFGPNYLLDWQDPMFRKISRIFMEKQEERYGTDHYYNIDPFNEMTPPSRDPEYITNMAKTIFSCIDDSDPEGTWVLMTWFCKNPSPDAFWSTERTKMFFDAVPDDRMLAIELWGDNWSGTGWHKQEGWYDKPWVWSILQSFGNRVDIYGDLSQILENYRRAETSPEKGRLQGMGIMTEGLGYNPVVYELVLDMMWGEGVSDIEKWRDDYLEKRYGCVPEPLEKSWDILFDARYEQSDFVDATTMLQIPRLSNVMDMNMRLVEAWRLMIESAKECPSLKENPAYQFDLVNLGREVMGGFFPYYLTRVKEDFENRNIDKFQGSSKRLLQYIRDFDRLLGTNEHFLLGEWISGARELGSTESESDLMEWGAKRQITDWGGKIGQYAIKEWSGIFKERTLPCWSFFMDRMSDAMKSGNDFDADEVRQECQEFLDKWPHMRSHIHPEPIGDPYEISRELFEKYEGDMEDYSESSGYRYMMKSMEVKGMAVGKPVTDTGRETGFLPEYAVDGELSGNYWGAVAPASITVDLLEPREVAAFHVYPWRGDGRHYQYTIEISVDGENWMQVVDMSNNTEPSSMKGHFHNYNAGYRFRYARLNMLRNSANPSVHVMEFKIYSPEDIEKLSMK